MFLWYSFQIKHFVKFKIFNANKEILLSLIL